MADGTTLLPNGWRIQPAGKHVRVGDMPLNLDADAGFEISRS